MSNESARGDRVICLTADGNTAVIGEGVVEQLASELAYDVETATTSDLRAEHLQPATDGHASDRDGANIRDVIEGKNGPMRVTTSSDIACVVIGATPSFSLRTTLRDQDAPIIVYDEVTPDDVPDIATDFVRSDRGTDSDAVVARLADRIRFHTNQHTTPTNDRDAQTKVEQLHEIATQLVACRRPSDVYQLVVSAAERVLEFDICGVDAVVDGVFVPRAVSAEMADVGYDRAPVDADSLAGVAHRTGESSVVDDIRTVEDASPADDEYRSVLTVPIGDEAVFQAGSRDVAAFSDADRELAELLAAHAEGTLHRIRSEQAIRDRRQTIERLHDIVAQMVACESERAVYDLLVDAAERVLQFSVCVVMLDEAEADYLTVRAASEADLAPPIGDTFRYDQGVAGETFRTGRAILVDDVSDYDPATPHDESYAACVSVPMGDFGVVQAISTEPNTFDEDDLELAELLASQAGVAITRLRAERQLRTEHDRLQALFRHIPDPAVSYVIEDGVPIVRDVNAAFECTFGYDADTISGESIDDYIVPSDRREEAEAINDRFHAGEAFQEEVRRARNDGTIRDFLLQIVPVTLDADNLSGYSIYTDITARKRRERRLGALHRTTRELLGATDAQEVAEIAVGAARETLGLKISGVHLIDEDEGLVPAAVSEEAISLFDGSPPTYTPDDEEIWSTFQDQRPRVFEEFERENVPNNAPVEAVLLQPLGNHGVFLSAAEDPDVFDESTVDLAGVLGANLTAAFTRAERETRLRERERELQRQNERLDAFTSVVSHDLRTPLSVARGHLDLAMDSHDDVETLTKVAEAHERMDALLSDLLELARKGQVVGDSESVPIEAAADAAWASVEAPAATLDLQADDAVVADRERLVQLFENLFSNSVDHSDGDVTITVGTTDHGFFVADDGPGIPEADRANVFDQGFSTSEDGTGFGLAIVAEIVDAHGWLIDVGESEAGGARFDITTN